MNHHFTDSFNLENLIHEVEVLKDFLAILTYKQKFVFQKYLFDKSWGIRFPQINSSSFKTRLF